MDLIMGDEFTPGANRHSIDLRPVSPIMTKELGTRTIVSAVKGVSLTGKGKLTLAHQLKQFSLAAYDRVFLFYGINDYLHSKAGLDVVNQKLTASLHELRHQNRWLHVYGILPFPIYDAKGHGLAQQPGVGAYTLHDLVEMLSVVYANNQIPVMNWSLLANPVVNQHNYQERLEDGKYPKPETAKLMGSRLAQFVRHADQRTSQTPRFKVQNVTPDSASPKISFFGKPAGDNQPLPRSNSASNAAVNSKHSDKKS